MMASSPRKKMGLTRGEKVCAFIEKYCLTPEGDHIGKPIKLEPFQRKFILEIYDNPVGTHSAYLSIARKNGKTALIAAILLAHLVGPEAVHNSQIISGAQSKDQAAVVFELAVKMIEMEGSQLTKLVRIQPSGKRLVGLARNVLYRALAAEGKTAHGLSPILAILDEVGQVVGPTDKFVSAITSAQGAYSNPLLIAISTQAPTDADLFSTWIDSQANAPDPRVVSHVYAAPDDCQLDDKSAWAAANPALGVFRSMPDMAKLCKTAMDMPANEPEFRNLNLNQRVEAVAPFVARSTWESNNGAPGDGAGLKVWAGLDLSSVNDSDQQGRRYCPWQYPARSNTRNLAAPHCFGRRYGIGERSIHHPRRRGDCSMKFASLIQETTTATNLATISLLGAVGVFRTFLQGYSVGQTGIPVTVFDASTGAYIEGEYTLTSGTLLTRSAIVGSSNNGADVAFAVGVKTVTCTLSAAQIAKFNSTNSIPYSTTIPLTAPGTSFMPQTAIAGAVAFALGANPLPGALVYLPLVGNGVNTPDFTAFKKWGGTLDFDNRSGILNQVQFFFDGTYAWCSISQEVGAVALPVPATGVTLTGPTSGVNGVASSNFTLGVTPVGGTISGTVVVTPSEGGVGGTFAPTTRSLTTASPTGTFTYTPSGVGAKTISVTNNGGLANPANITYTANASATVPATMTAPVATAGDATASIAFTAPSNGGSAITGYMVTPYIGAAAQAPQTFGAGAGPFTVTGLTNATAYTFKIKATNGVGPGVDSPASNSVTPVAAPTTSNARLSPMNGMTESGTGPWSYAGAGQNFGASFGGVSSTGLASGQDGSLAFTLGNYNTSGNEAMLSIASGSTVVPFSNCPYSVFSQGGGPKYLPFTGGTGGTPVNNVVPANGDVLRMRRSGSNLIAEVSKNSGSTWTEIFTWTGVPTTALKFQVSCAISSQANNLAGTGLV